MSFDQRVNPLCLGAIVLGGVYGVIERGAPGEHCAPAYRVTPENRCTMVQQARMCGRVMGSALKRQSSLWWKPRTDEVNRDGAAAGRRSTAVCQATGTPPSAG